MNTSEFSRKPILNSPYAEPDRHWVLGEDGLPTGEIEKRRRNSEYLIPIPGASKQHQNAELNLRGTDEQKRKEQNDIVNTLRDELSGWRQKPLDQRKISPATQKLLAHWYGSKVDPMPFFCQIEAIETFIWLNEVAPGGNEKIKNLLRQIKEESQTPNLGLERLAAKMATGSGKTMLMAMLIAYYSINRERNPRRKIYSNRFLIIAPGITIKDRLRVLLPQDPNNYYEKCHLVPREMLPAIRKAIVVITNYHAFQRREKEKLSTKHRKLLRGYSKHKIETRETDGEILRRVCPELLRAGSKIVVINDEAHHCYFDRQDSEEHKLAQEEKVDAKRNREAARLWINGIRKLDGFKSLQMIYDLSATPFFLRGSGHGEGTLFPWVVSDFSLMDAIESGIVKLPRVPTKDGTQEELPIYRNLYKYVRKDLPKGSAKKQAGLDPQRLPSQLMGALQTLYSHYVRTDKEWSANDHKIPPVFIIVCNNTSTSKLVYDYISGYQISGKWRSGQFRLFNNVNERENALLEKPQTILIDSYELESGEKLSNEFKKAAQNEIDLFKQEMRVRFPDKDARKITDADILREVMNTVGKKGQLGEQIRCVVSVSMLTEGWDASNVTHILGVRAFSTQLLCEQVVGRGLRRVNHAVDDAKKFSPEYVNVFGVPFDFAPDEDDSCGPTPPPPPRRRVYHLDERSERAITFPRLAGYRIRPPERPLRADFDSENAWMEINSEDAPPTTKVEAITGEQEELTLDDLKQKRPNEIAFRLAAQIADRYYKPDEGKGEGAVSPKRFKELLTIVRDWLEHYVHCSGGTSKAYLWWNKLADIAVGIIYRACTVAEENKSNVLLPLMHPYSPEGSTHEVDFMTGKILLHETAEDKCHINLAVCDSTWEMQFCQVLEDDPAVFSYVRNDHLDFEIPYEYNKESHNYLPDFIVRLDDGRGQGDLLNLIVEIKGKPDNQTRAKADTAKSLWVPAVNNDGRWGRWAYVEIKDPHIAKKTLHSFIRSSGEAA